MVLVLGLGGSNMPVIAETQGAGETSISAKAQIVYKATYRHRSRGRELPAPATVTVTREKKDGPLTATVEMPWNNGVAVAVGGAGNTLTHYTESSAANATSPGYSVDLAISDGSVSLTRRGIREDQNAKALTVPAGAIFDPNSRPDPYATASVLLPGLRLKAGESKEVMVYDWDNAGEGMAVYKIRYENKGVEEVITPAGKFSANHITLM